MKGPRVFWPDAWEKSERSPAHPRVRRSAPDS
jgi:hypothetical protein